MTAVSPLETRLRTLIARYRKLMGLNRQLETRLNERELQIRELERQNERLRAQIDRLDKDRFILKQLKDERKIIRRGLDVAITRLNALEQEL